MYFIVVSVALIPDLTSGIQLPASLMRIPIRYKARNKVRNRDKYIFSSITNDTLIF